MDSNVTDTLLSEVPCMQLQSAESSKTTKYYLSASVKRMTNRKRKAAASIKTYAKASRYGPDMNGKKKRQRQISQQFKTDSSSSTVGQPANTAAALSLIRNPPTDQVRTKLLVPRMLAGIEDTTKRGRGRVTDEPQKRTIKVCRRVVGLNGCTVEDRVFDTKKERKRFLQQQRRAKEKVCKDCTGMYSLLIKLHITYNINIYTIRLHDQH